VAVLREAVERGLTHIDTSDYYGPHTVNQLIREALHPYPPQLRIVTKVGARRGPDKSWPSALSRDELISAVHDNLRNLGVDTLDVVNLRVGDVERPKPGSLAEPFTTLAQLREQGLIRHLGVSGVSSEQLTEARSIAPVVCVQNLYNVTRRADDELVDRCARQASRTRRSSRRAGSCRCSRGCSTASPPGWARRPTKSRLRGCCSTRPRSCSSQAPRRWRTCARTSPQRTWNCRWTRSLSSTRSVQQPRHGATRRSESDATRRSIDSPGARDELLRARSPTLTLARHKGAEPTVNDRRVGEDATPGA
jgi:aldo/keto reductase family protein